MIQGYFEEKKLEFNNMKKNGHKKGDGTYAQPCSLVIKLGHHCVTHTNILELCYCSFNNVISLLFRFLTKGVKFV